MKFQRIKLSNFKCYDDADLRLDDGVTVIHGLNGSGKSSLLEACFFALYGSKALDENLGDVVTIGADDCTVDLWFSHAGGDYHLTRRVRATGAQPTTAKCVLETPDGNYEGARDVRRRITELLRMDSEAFVNCAYVRQGEVNKLINASPSDRQDMLDDLLQLGKLEEYRERASDARVGVGRVRDDKQGALSQLDEQIQEKEEKELHGRLNSLETQESELQDEIEHIEDQKATAEETLTQAESVLEEYEEKRGELSTLEDDIEELETTITESETKRTELKEQISDLQDRRESLREDLSETVAETDLDSADPDPETVDARLDELQSRDDELQSRIEDQRVDAKEYSSTADALTESAADLESRVEEKREQADELAADIESARETIAERREQVSDIDDQIADLEARFEDAPTDRDGATSYKESVASDLDDARQRVTELETTLESERESLAEAEALLEAGKCPECGQDVAESPHVDSIEDDREQIAELEETLADAREDVSELESEHETATELVETADELSTLENNRSNIRQLVEEKEAGLDADQERIETLREEAAEHESEAETKREKAAEAREQAEDCRSVVAECNQERQQVKQAIKHLERVEDLLGDIDDCDDDIERLREKRSQQAELNDQRRDQLAEKRERKQELAESFDEERIEEARNEKQRATKYIEQAEETLAEKREKRDELQNAIGGVTNEIEELESLRERREDLEATLEKLDTLYEETEELQEMYGTLRAELRQRNVETLERMLNQTFDLVYQNDSYSHIELDGQYQLTVYQKDGEPLEPEQLSGGERALFNLSLRCAIYRLLAEGIEGAAPMPPLILDEPTVFLDSGHVTQLLDLVEYMRDEVGVEQILVVSHDEELVGAADALVRVEKDATTNRSRVEQVEATAAELA
ncbi:DNA double-strand break repair Rad50 ATPase [Haloarcula sp. CBA1130]|uniref:DNA double-strand break repair ATPase Rad50 n=1 Tax=unclassified Haloarcula TaxID=2624677 RepID=UPI001244793B|nr:MULTISPECIES: DNA double-strand break repair ATPase Rad50 [unclassified Haloarcula]KAA9396831.1 DNA double-strand break repair Rad50 ATPase [Haloarcula sp. CBA1129]KAA9401791.1 DNA double-strand break repair Rad50 ATPase [Haloarcula sp. CBA1130]